MSTGVMMAMRYKFFTMTISLGRIYLRSRFMKLLSPESTEIDGSESLDFKNIPRLK